MKKLFLILGFVIVAVTAYCQTASFSVKSVMSKDITSNYSLSGTIADTFLFTATKNYYTMQSYNINLDSASGNHTAVATSLYGRIFTTDAWTQVGSTITWKGTTADTTFKIESTAPNKYNYFMVRLVGTGTGVTTIDSQTWQQWYVPTSTIYHAVGSQSAGLKNAVTLNFSPDIPALYEGLRVSFVADSANTGATTIAIDGGEAKAIYEQEGATPNALDANDIRVGTVQDLLYNGTQWIKLSPSGN
jgi:hypothetical protein